MGLYGNIISHIPRSHFDIVKSVPNQATLTTILNDIEYGQYVLVNYDLGGGFSSNLIADNNINYHNTVWQKGQYTTQWMAPGTTSIWDVPAEQKLNPPTPTFFAIARLHSNLIEKPNEIIPASVAQANQKIQQYTLVPVTTNQIPEIVAEPKEFNNFGVAEVTIPDGFQQSGSITIISPMNNDNPNSKHSIETVLPLYGTTSYTYLTH